MLIIVLPACCCTEGSGLVRLLNKDATWSLMWLLCIVNSCIANAGQPWSLGKTEYMLCRCTLNIGQV
jgi:hypothetical protein